MAAPQGVQFDGSTPDYLSRGADLTGNADSKLVTGAFWVRFNSATASAAETIWFSHASFSTRLAITRPTNESIAIAANNSSATEILNVNSGASSVADTSWHHVMFSFDLANASNRHLYLDDSDVLNVSTYTNDTIDFTVSEHNVGSVSGIANHLPGDLADFWLDFGTYIDLSVASNRRKFVGASAASSVDLGSDGSNPTGSAPIVFLSGATATWHTNDGGGGGFTENGALTDASTNPPDYGGGGTTPTTSLDAILKKQGNLLTASLDAAIANRNTKIATLSSVLQKMQTISASASGILKATNTTATASLDAVAVNRLIAETPGYQPIGVNFDGMTPDYLNRGADLTGSADSKLVTFSFWFRTSTTDFDNIFSSANDRFTIGMNGSGGTIEIYGQADPSGFILIATSSGGFNDGQWHHCCGSFDMSDTGKRHLFLDDSSDLSVSTYTDSAIDFTRTDHGVGASSTGSSAYTGDIADLWIDFGTYIDFSTSSNRRLFVGSGAGTAIDLGSDGSTPTGSAPIVYLHGAVATWHTNDGDGGGFTENGALSAASENPPAGDGGGPATVDAILQLVSTKAALLDAALKLEATKTASVDSLLVSRVAATASMDAALQQAYSLVFTIDAVLQQMQTQTASADALLVNLRTTTASLGAALLAQQSATANVSGVLQDTFSTSASLDGLLRTGFWQSDDTGSDPWSATGNGNDNWSAVPSLSTTWGNA